MTVERDVVIIVELAANKRERMQRTMKMVHIRQDGGRSGAHWHRLAELPWLPLGFNIRTDGRLRWSAIVPCDTYYLMVPLTLLLLSKNMKAMGYHICLT
jgi:hypothetical protein